MTLHEIGGSGFSAQGLGDLLAGTDELALRRIPSEFGHILGVDFEHKWWPRNSAGDLPEARTNLTIARTSRPSSPSHPGSVLWAFRARGSGARTRRANPTTFAAGPCSRAIPKNLRSRVWARCATRGRCR